MNPRNASCGVFVFGFKRAFVQSSKFQAPNSREDPKLKIQSREDRGAFRAWLLELPGSLDVGAWIFVPVLMRFDDANQDGDADAEQQCDREFRPVVGMKLQLR
jgi:hypothetical protein